MPKSSSSCSIPDDRLERFEAEQKIRRDLLKKLLPSGQVNCSPISQKRENLQDPIASQ